MHNVRRKAGVYFVPMFASFALLQQHHHRARSNAIFVSDCASVCLSVCVHNVQRRGSFIWRDFVTDQLSGPAG